jgi:hypothetical protein
MLPPPRETIVPLIHQRGRDVFGPELHCASLGVVVGVPGEVGFQGVDVMYALSPSPSPV